MDAPDGFGWRRRGADTFLLREDIAPTLEPVLRAALEGGVSGDRLAGGRGGAVAIDLEGGVSAVIRHNRRGGAVAWVVDDLYFGLHPRPFDEVVATERLRRAGIAVPEALGAIVRRVAGLWYRGAVATRRIPASVTVWERLRQTPDPVARHSLCALVIDAVRALHAAGADHPDLNLQNLLVTGDGVESKLWVIDGDKVRFSGKPEQMYEQAVRRLVRSSQRLDPEQRVIDPSWFR